ncbi:MAG: metal-dependent hydrolase [Leptospiraceae bacterium]|nr:metal-dependent hydrolase [Leptospiraceae bacterium]
MTKHTIKVHKINPNFEYRPPRHWLNDNALLTHILNTFTLIFPDVERFFVRSLKNLDQELINESLNKDLKGFIGQEISHALVHEKMFSILEDQDYEINFFLYPYRKISYEIIEPLLSKKFAVALTAGLEHFTALFANVGLKHNILLNADRMMKEIFEWHAAEELEHKSVAYDVMIELGVTYEERILAFLLATLLFTGFLSFGVLFFLTSDGELFSIKTMEELNSFFFGDTKMSSELLEIFWEYFDPNFHPSKKEDYYLAERVFASAI